MKICITAANCFIGLPLVKKASSLLNDGLHQVFVGPLVSGDCFVSDSQKVSFIQKYYPEALACEMEGCAIAHTCYANKVPFVIIRCMSDCADENVKETYSEDTASKLSSTFLMEVIKEI